jgi:hypothetical protein
MRKKIYWPDFQLSYFVLLVISEINKRARERIKCREVKLYAIEYLLKFAGIGFR